MKWFRHNSDSYINLKTQALMEEFGLAGYGFFWLCCELVAQQGSSYKIKSAKNWRKALKKISKLPDKKIELLLEKLASLNLISKNGLKKGDLWIPKMREYSDEYTKKVRRVSRQSQDKVPLHNTTLHNNTIHNKTILQDLVNYFFTLKGWANKEKEFYEKNKIVYARFTRPAKNLLKLCDNDLELAKKKLDEIKDWAESKNLEWGLETPIKRFFEKNISEEMPMPKRLSLKELLKKK